MASGGVTGVLLVGGASRRFGSPKALARIGGETLAERTWRLLGEVSDERLAIGKVEDGLPLPFSVVDDGSEVRAPLVGVVAALRIARHDVCVFVPVDCPLLSPESLRLLATVAPSKVQTGPLPGAYPRSMLPLFERKLVDGDYSLRDVEATVLDVPRGELVNVNTAADLERATALAQ